MPCQETDQVRLGHVRSGQVRGKARDTDIDTDTAPASHLRCWLSTASVLGWEELSSRSSRCQSRCSHDLWTLRAFGSFCLALPAGRVTQLVQQPEPSAVESQTRKILLEDRIKILSYQISILYLITSHFLRFPCMLEDVLDDNSWRQCVVVQEPRLQVSDLRVTLYKAEVSFNFTYLVVIYAVLCWVVEYTHWYPTGIQRARETKSDAAVIDIMWRHCTLIRTCDQQQQQQ